MTVKNVIKIIDHVIQRKSQKKSDFMNPEMSWNKGRGQVMEFSLQLASVMDDDIKILRLVRAEIQPKCAHSKKDQDIDPDGNLYCMGCNLDL